MYCVSIHASQMSHEIGRQPRVLEFTVDIFIFAIQQNAYQTTTKLSLVICEYGLRELRAVWPSSSMYLLLCYDRRSGDDMTHLLMYENLMIVRS